MIAAFENYIKNFDLTIPIIKMKYDHTLRVATRASELALELNLSKDDVELAYLIGFVHDIGRFEQIATFNTLIDAKSFDHGDYGVEVLFGQNLIRKFTKNSDDDEIIKKAVRNHNKFRIEDGLSNREILFCKMIRDADKIDVYEVILKNEFPVDWNGQFTEKIIEDFRMKKQITNSDRKTRSDEMIAFLSWVYDIHFDWTLKYIETHYLEDLKEKAKNNTTEEYVLLFEKYIKEKIKNGNKI